MAMWYWSVAILFWQLSIDYIVNNQCKRCGFTKTRLRHPSLPFDSLPYPTRTICRRVRMYVRTLNQSLDNQTKRAWPYSMSMGLCPTRASRYQPSWVFPQKETKSITYTKGYWVSVIMMYDLKGSLQGSVCLSDFAKETYSKHQNRPNLLYRQNPFEKERLTYEHKM